MRGFKKADGKSAKIVKVIVLLAAVGLIAPQAIQQHDKKVARQAKQELLAEQQLSVEDADVLGVSQDPVEDTNDTETTSDDAKKVASFVEGLFAKDSDDAYTDEYHAMLIASVVMNRVDSPDYPDSINGVLDQMLKVLDGVTLQTPSEMAIIGAQEVVDNGEKCIDAMWILPSKLWYDEEGPYYNLSYMVALNDEYFILQ